MTDTATSATTQGAHHIGLTVPNLDETRNFFLDTLGYEQVGEVPDYPAAFLSDGNLMITIWQAADPDKAVLFDRKNNIGLHHLALNVRDTDALNVLHDRLTKNAGIDVEFGPEPLGDLPVRHMMCYIPGGVRVEFIAPNG